MITADTTLAAINPDLLPDTSERFHLPGAVDLPNRNPNQVSGKQVKIIVRYAKDNIPASATFAQAIAQLRSKFLVGAQQDFNLVEKILEETRAENAENDLSDAQNKMVITILSALAGTANHWDMGINAKIASAPKALKSTFIMSLSAVRTQGQLTVFMDRFAAVFGRPQPKAGLGEPLMAQSTVAAAPETALEEPF